MNEQNEKLPTFFWVIGVVALLWNLMGVFNFVMQTFMTEQVLAAMPDEQKELFEATPGWMAIVFAVAVIAGTLGSLGLLMKKSWAVSLFLLSLVAVIIQMGYSLMLTDAVKILGGGAVVMPLVVIIFAGFLYYYSKSCRTKGWIT